MMLYDYEYWFCIGNKQKYLYDLITKISVQQMKIEILDVQRRKNTFSIQIHDNSCNILHNLGHPIY